ncbi:MAG TPA: 50S ribosomal protein L30 [archaeon]|nr:50S ribosomal protein L30 [archaeon]
MTEIYAIVRIRGDVNARKEIDDTLAMLKLKKTNNCMIYPKTDTITGMLKKARTYLTWGELKEDTLVKLLNKRGRLEGDKKLDEKKSKELAEKLAKENSSKSLGIKLPIRLSPPSKGFASVKQPYPKGDAGYRGEKINELLERMI